MANSVSGRRLNFLGRALRRWILSDEDISLFGIDHPIFLKFNSLKREIAERTRGLHPFILSLGGQCQPHTIMHGYHFSMLRHARLPFDLQTTPLEAVINVIENNFSTLRANAFIKTADSAYFFNRELNIGFNHDKIDDLNTFDRKLEKFNALLRQKTRNFYEYIKNDNLIGFLSVPIDSLDVLKKVDHLIWLLNRKFNINRVFILNTMGANPLIIHEKSIATVNTPSPDYSWFDFSHVLTEGGFAYESRIVNRFCTYLANVMEKGDSGADICHLDPDACKYADFGQYFYEEGNLELADKCIGLASGLSRGSQVENTAINNLVKLRNS